MFCPVTQVMSRIRWHHRVRFGGVCGGRRPWAELLPWASSGAPLAGWDNLSGGNFEAMPTEPDMRGFLWWKQTPRLKSFGHLSVSNIFWHSLTAPAPNNTDLYSFEMWLLAVVMTLSSEEYLQRWGSVHQLCQHNLHWASQTLESFKPHCSAVQSSAQQFFNKNKLRHTESSPNECYWSTWWNKCLPGLPDTETNCSASVTEDFSRIASEGLLCEVLHCVLHFVSTPLRHIPFQLLNMLNEVTAFVSFKRERRSLHTRLLQWTRLITGGPARVSSHILADKSQTCHSHFAFENQILKHSHILFPGPFL